MGTNINDWDNEVTSPEIMPTMAQLVGIEESGRVLCTNLAFETMESRVDARMAEIDATEQALDFGIELLSMGGPLFDGIDDGFPFLAAGDLERYPASK